MPFSRIEIRDLFVSTLVIAFAFTVLLREHKGILGIEWELFLTMIVAVGFSFVLHELAHRYVARNYGCLAEYRMWPLGLVIALFSAFFGVVFAAPGAVYILGSELLGKRENGIISASGPAVNIFLSGLFFAISFYPPLWRIGNIGHIINAWIAFFNLLPIPPLDGSKILKWQTPVWIGMMAISLALLLPFFGLL